MAQGFWVNKRPYFDVTRVAFTDPRRISKYGATATITATRVVEHWKDRRYDFVMVDLVSANGTPIQWTDGSVIRHTNPA